MDTSRTNTELMVDRYSLVSNLRICIHEPLIKQMKSITAILLTEEGERSSEFSLINVVLKILTKPVDM